MKTLAGELGPAGIRINGLLPVRMPPPPPRELDALRGDPDEKACRRSPTLGGTAAVRATAAYLLSWPRPSQRASS